ncbi:uncharacterized protein LOC108904736 [Anoplophora glabripennis]|uniref:uncharacterized protein LOC108904736 n=1 Tax=Anoplophora glabripennis TaxID=217634 RepID=UPI000C791C9B|nr:uncharacterized protein LOC108904736 [Anoplophora glabripennis]
MSDKSNFLLLFDRPQEPCFMPKGDKKCVFDVPLDYLPDKYKSVGTVVMSRFGQSEGEDQIPKIAVKQISIPPLDDVMKLRRDENFSLFIHKHRQIAARLIDIFLGMKTVDDLLSVSVYARDRVNPYLFNYALSVALLHRPDTQNLDLPSFIQSFPDKFVDAKVFNAAREIATVVPEDSRTPILIDKDFTASDLEEEHRLAYFREDLGINLHHWHWHLVYPFEAAREVVDKDRRGELFYYMHQQIVARYNFERLCNKLKRVERFINWKEEIKEAYFPKLDSAVASRTWPARSANQKLSNLKRDADQVVLDIDDMERWRDRIFEAIGRGAVRNADGSETQLDEFGGIDILGNMVESSILSPNRGFYGDLHNMGHMFFACIHDPDHRHLEPFGVIGDSATAMRDPVFYRWHAYIDDLFQEYKSALPRYPEERLNNPGITVDHISIESSQGKNILNTLWQQSDVDLSRGLDFQPRGSILVRFTHLQHVEFTYNIVVSNTSGGVKEGTCRIFLSPKFDERGNPWKFQEQRLMFIELDKFKVNLNQGENNIKRTSTQSSVTIPFERTFRNLDANRPTGDDAQAQFNLCGCGWPQHMLIPKGAPEGISCQLFVMISNYDDDKIDQDISGVCKNADSFCGIKDKKYPDRRSMGYPFDRQARDGVTNLREFLTPNMRVQDVTIQFSDKVYRKSGSSRIPQEPSFMPKGDTKSVFDLPPDYLPDKYKSVGTLVVSRFGQSEEGDQFPKIAVKKISIPPLDEVMQLRRDENFSLFIPRHRQMAASLINIFLGVRTVDDLLSVAVYARDRVNPYLFNYALSVALLHRPDTQNLDLPSFIHSFPDKFVDAKVFNAARETATVVPEDSRTPIVIDKDFTASDLEEEHRLAYFREDLGINLHHWHWHLVYPFEAAREVVDKDRRGELFYYMHQQVVARYNFERLCNKLKRVERFINWKEEIKEAYFPKLDSTVASRSWPARSANQKLSNLKREVDQIVLDIDDLERWRDRIFEAINRGVVRNSDGSERQLDEFGGIDILGNMVESSILSPDRGFYGDLHNMGHVFLSYIHDPDHRNLESFGVIGDSTTAMRDPVFYRWHAYIDDLFQEYKSTLPRYSEDRLNNPGITVDQISIESSQGKNTLNTLWQQSDVDLSRGLDFQPRGSVFVRFTHLQHVEFTYNIVVNNTSGGNKEGTCRIFLSPKFDERGNPWKFQEQRLMFIELDKFKVNLKQGKNNIKRTSNQSSVTIPFERTFRDQDNNRPTGGEALAQFNFCGCGWPQHMLIPKGTPEGIACQLFVMISNYADDRIDQDITGICNDADSFCGIKDKKYPDRRSMGYPFDRQARDGVTNLREFLTPNMRVQDVTIKFTDQVFQKTRPSRM